MQVKTYNLERTVCDIIKDKDSLDIEIRNKAIKNCIKSKEFNANKMFEYAKKMKIYEKVKNRILPSNVVIKLWTSASSGNVKI